MATSIISMKRRRQKLHKNRLFQVSLLGDNMKSDIISQPKVHLHKLSSGTNPKVVVNDGITEPCRQTEKMTLCVSENSEPAKMSQVSKLLTKQLEKPPDGVLTDLKPNSEEPKLSKEESQETRKLKELLLLHLDLIQQQQELLAMKDNQLQQVTKEKESLRCRLERMERRMQLLRHNSTGRGEHSALLSSPSSPTSSSPHPHAPASLDSKRQTASASASLQSRGVKRKSSLEPTSLVKKFATIARNEYQRDRSRHHHHHHHHHSHHHHSHSNTATASHSNSVPPRSCRTRTRDHHHHHPLLDDTTVTDQDDENSSQSSRQSSSHNNNKTATAASSVASKDNNSSSKNKTKITLRTPKPSSSTSRRLSKSERQRRRIPKEDKIMRTDVMYYVPDETAIVPMDISPRKPEKDEVDVPSFRIKVVPRGYTMEGTENLGDEIYLKRHSKPETDEKRRKRWDMQRLREQKANEHLQQSRRYRDANGGQDDEEEFDSFLPDPDKVEFIEVCDEIPVSAFGFPLPKVDSEEFSLPWFDLERHEPAEKSRSRSRRR